jgi:hypothetical protein
MRQQKRNSAARCAENLCGWLFPCQRSAKCDFVEANPSCEGAR